MTYQLENWYEGDGEEKGFANHSVVLSVNLPAMKQCEGLRREGVLLTTVLC